MITIDNKKKTTSGTNIQIIVLRSYGSALLHLEHGYFVYFP